MTFEVVGTASDAGMAVFARQHHWMGLSQCTALRRCQTNDVRKNAGVHMSLHDTDAAFEVCP